MRPTSQLAAPVYALALLALAGCSGSTSPTTTPSTPTPTPANTAATSFYVYQNNNAFSPPFPSMILQFSKTGSGVVTPLSTITGPANIVFQSLVEDPQGNLYVGANTYNASPNTGPGTIDLIEYAAGASGTATPSRTITGLATGLQVFSTNNIASLDLDSTGNLYVAAPVAFGSGPTGLLLPGISVFAPSASGNVAPVRVITGPLTTMTTTPAQMAVTPAGAVYYPASAIQAPASILVFAPAATGNIAPIATIGGPLTTLYNIKGIATDAAGNIYVASQSQATTNAADSAIPSILEFAAGATGNVSPIRTITGSATTMGFVSNLRLDSAGNIYIVNGTILLKFAPGVTGNVAPVASITSTAYFQPAGSIAVQ